MLSLFHIKTIALFEAKTLFRSWFFRILGILMLTIIFFFDLAQMFFDWDPMFLSTPTAIPYSNILLFNVVQAIIAVFLASDFLKRDKKLDTTEVIYTRSMSNGDYVIGKLLGNLYVFTILNLLILGMAFIFNLVSKDHALIAEAYLYYFLLVSVPTLIFIIGLSFLLMNIIKNQAVTFAILIGYVFLTMFYLKNQYYYLFDYMAYNIPLLYSDIIGFINPSRVILHRLMYVLLGLSFISFTVSRLWRLPNKPFSNTIPIALAALFLSGGLYLGYLHVNDSMRGEKLRREMIALNNLYSRQKTLDIGHQHIQLNHRGKTISCEVSLTAFNRSHGRIDTLLLRLNPGLTIEKLEVEGKPTAFDRMTHLLAAVLPTPLNGGDSLSITLSYAGSIDDEACYLDIDEKTRRESNDHEILRIGKIYSCLRDYFVLLTPESNWYPMADVGFNKCNTSWMAPRFCRFSLTVKTTNGLTPVSQGEPRVEGNSTFFTTTQPIPGLSVAIGNYIRQTLSDSIPRLGAYVMPGHDFYSKAFGEVKDTASRIVRQALADYGEKIRMSYPFNSLYLVEVPAQVSAYPRFWSNHMEQLQPGLILIPEKGGKEYTFRFARNLKRKKEQSDSKGKSDKELQEEELKDFLDIFTRKVARNRFIFENRSLQEIEELNPFFIFDQYFAFNHPVVSGKHPIFNTFLGSYCFKQADGKKTNSFSFGFSENERAVILLKSKSMSEIFSDPTYSHLADNIVLMKGDALFSLIEKRIGKGKLDGILDNIFKANQFRIIDFDDFNSYFTKETGQDLSVLLDTWMQSDRLPAYRVGSVSAFKVMDGDRQRFMTRFTIANEGNIDGIVKAAIRELGTENGDNSSEPEFKTYVIGSRQAVTINMLTNKQPNTLVLNTNIARNIPVKQEVSVGKAENEGYMKASEEQTAADLKSITNRDEIIVDNEDSLFTVKNTSGKGLLIGLVNRFASDADEYQAYEYWFVGGKWGKYIKTFFYGQYVHSAACIRSGKGSATAVWRVPVPEKGRYDIYTYIPKSTTDEYPQHLGVYSYTIYHDDGSELVRVNTKDADEGWYLLGTYYCSPGNTRVELSNESNSRVLVADAVKAVRL
jgi:ABC-type transport system involved in multi-copper enzyme maturation permease subunit